MQLTITTRVGTQTLIKSFAVRTKRESPLQGRNNEHQVYSFANLKLCGVVSDGMLRVTLQLGYRADEFACHLSLIKLWFSLFFYAGLCDFYGKQTLFRVSINLQANFWIDKNDRISWSIIKQFELLLLHYLETQWILRQFTPKVRLTD